MKTKLQKVPGRIWPAVCKDIELKFGIETKFGALNSKTNINLQFDVIMRSL